jgi:hypothetical protein
MQLQVEAGSTHATHSVPKFLLRSRTHFIGATKRPINARRSALPNLNFAFTAALRSYYEGYTFPSAVED